ncbi:MAG: ribosome biogenesis GTP-binding protein YihA/YsxC [Thermoanaerobaculia bacterium]
MTTTLSSARSGAGFRPGVRGPLAAGAEVRLVLPAYARGERPKGEAVPALAVLGRSNVGKSSLLNSLLGTKVARVSQTPGRTQALFWYRVGEKFDVVDCPGYGYAKTAKEKREAFEGLIEDLLLGSPGGAPVSAALLLIDSRLEPQASDLSMSLFLRESSVPTVVAATKWDAVKPSQRVRQHRMLAAAFGAPDRPLLPVSSETGEHLSELARLLIAALSPASKE